MLHSRASTRGRDTRRVVAQPFQTRALQTTECLRPQMFAKETSKKEQSGRPGTARRGSRGRGAAGQDDRPPDATARIRAHGNGESRERRVRIRGKQRGNGSHGSQQRSIRKRGVESQEDQRRSVQGAPDAMFRMLAFRLAAPVEQQKNDLDGAVGALKEQYQELAQQALLTVLTTGRQAENDKDMRAKRCFDVKYKDGQRQCIIWILAAAAHPEFIHARIERPEANKDTGTCADQGRGGQSNDEQGSQGYHGRSQGQRKRRWLLAERSEQRDEHSKSSAVHHDKVWGVISWNEFSKENLTMARCGALRGEARLGQVVANWDSLIFFNVSSVRVRACTQSAVGGTLVRIRVVVAAC